MAVDKDVLRDIQHRVMFSDLYRRMEMNLRSIRSLDEDVRALTAMRLLEFKGSLPLNEGAMRAVLSTAVIGNVYNLDGPSGASVEIDGVTYRAGENVVCVIGTGGERVWDRFTFDVSVTPESVFPFISHTDDGVLGWGHYAKRRGFAHYTEDGGALAVVLDDPTDSEDGRLNLQIDGVLYQDEGIRRVLDEGYADVDADVNVLNGHKVYRRVGNSRYEYVTRRDLHTQLPAYVPDTAGENGGFAGTSLVFGGDDNPLGGMYVLRLADSRASGVYTTVTIMVTSKSGTFTSTVAPNPNYVGNNQMPYLVCVKWVLDGSSTFKTELLTCPVSSDGNTNWRTWNEGRVVEVFRVFGIEVR